VIEGSPKLPLLTHGGGLDGFGSTFALAPTRGLAAVALFNHRAGYGLTGPGILSRLLGIDGEKTSASTTPRLKVAGRYLTQTPGEEGLPDTFVVASTGTGLTLTLDCRTEQNLIPAGDRVFCTQEGVSVGFPPESKVGMLDALGLGLVSAWPYLREELSKP
jgi:hypothetical protein